MVVSLEPHLKPRREEGRGSLKGGEKKGEHGISNGIQSNGLAIWIMDMKPSYGGKDGLPRDGFDKQCPGSLHLHSRYTAAPTVTTVTDDDTTISIATGLTTIPIETIDVTTITNMATLTPATPVLPQRQVKTVNLRTGTTGRQTYRPDDGDGLREHCCTPVCSPPQKSWSEPRESNRERG
ncbi:protein eva-1 homolog A isoform X3 [Esox lucius]|uniref:protein eva-1 homolog A isoform X3 n=1 Tax=Esox lucius TaxID=8010 RepID=UPI0014773775|nr:protein eva-1 homolog A isoform X3 [Esox lucius]XP_034153255.1 protein eva-1 homolog A isoform X3 [Esox lucius]XP_034153256.1 protein eva-1 homolog A isoform X3 [Esox lucius]